MPVKPETTDELVMTTRTPEETEALGKILAGLTPDGTVVALRGELAAGKTCLVRGMCAVLAPGARVSSPTFTLINEYRSDRTLYHVDLYRTNGVAEIFDLGYEDLFDDAAGVCAVEWAERAAQLLPKKRIDVSMVHEGGDKRRISIENIGLFTPGWQVALRNEFETLTR